MKIELFSKIKDESCKEKVFTYIRTVNCQILEAEDVFLDLNETPDITRGLSIQNLRWQCYDDRNNVSGTTKRVQARITEMTSKAQYSYCFSSDGLSQRAMKTLQVKHVYFISSLQIALIKFLDLFSETKSSSVIPQNILSTMLAGASEAI
ncbi:hypothetical protein PR048_001156 [Dryococelus australis]|uniref:Uncharacterized protein n=1 Tax=Dryococelus australis TaxID=614101 RepID=A0ABQ9IGK9_9NEOP|nr:hypothetical protein PR048_001156 [Dryococelus australis]